MKTKRDKTEAVKDDFILSTPAVKGSYGTESSSHVTSDSSGFVGLDDKSLLPNFSKINSNNQRTEKLMDLRPTDDSTKQ